MNMPNTEAQLFGRVLASALIARESRRSKVTPQARVVSFSGGRTSGYMLRALQQLPDWKDMIVLFANTGRERNETLDFVRDVGAHWGINIVWLEYRRRNDAHDFDVVDYETASRLNDPRPFNELLGWATALPNPIGRTCTANLKIRTMKRYLQRSGVESWMDAIGIRADERHRSLEIKAQAPSYITPVFPLVDAGIVESDVMEFWKQQPFDLGLRPDEGNCDLCFLKSRSKKLRLIRERPGSADWWIEQERMFEARGAGDGARWRLGATYAGLLDNANRQAILPGCDDDEDIACSCMERGTWDDETTEP